MGKFSFKIKISITKSLYLSFIYLVNINFTTINICCDELFLLLLKIKMEKRM